MHASVHDANGPSEGERQRLNLPSRSGNHFRAAMLALHTKEIKTVDIVEVVSSVNPPSITSIALSPTLRGVAFFFLGLVAPLAAAWFVEKTLLSYIREQHSLILNAKKIKQEKEKEEMEEEEDRACLIYATVV